MRNALRMTVLFGAVASTGLAQTDFHCKLEGSSLIGHRDGVAEYEVDFQETWSSKPVTVSAHAFVPDSDKPVAGSVFSVSAIQKFDQRTDLMPFARALARAGAASIVVEHAVKWEPLDEQWNTAPTVMHCAGQWMLKNVRLHRDRLAIAGPDRWREQAWINFGWTGPVESRKTESMMTVKGQIQMADFVRRTLELSAVRPEWLSVERHEAKNEHMNVER